MMESVKRSDLEARLARLERQNRVLERCLLLVGAGLTLFMALAASSGVKVQDVVRAKAFELVDNRGVVCAELSLSDKGAAGLTLFDAEGKSRVWLGTSGEGPAGLTITTADGKYLGMFTVGKEGPPILTLYQTGGSTAEFGMYNDGSASLDFRDREQKTRAMLKMDKDASSSLKLLDGEGNELFSAP